MMKTTLLAIGTVCILSATSLHAETTITLKEMHLCCGACTKGVTEAVSKVEGVTINVDAKAGTATLTAGDDASARKAVNAVGRAGFHGVSDHKKIKMRDTSGVEPGKVTRLELVGVHNCCAGCCKAIKKAVAEVDGVEGDTAQPKKRTFVVEGNFDGQKLIQALYKAGFHARQKKEKKES